MSGVPAPPGGEPDDPDRGFGETADAAAGALGQGERRMMVTAADLVAREAELARLSRLVAAASEGVSGALVLSGAAGLGKTALVDATVTGARGFIVLRARGVEGESQLPYAALSQLLLSVLDLRTELSRDQRAALEGPLALGPPSDHDAVAVAAAVLALLTHAAEDAPVLIAVDDLHWVDEASLAVLRILSRRLGGEGIAVLLATRPDAAPPAGLEVVDLAPLSDAGARELLARAGRLEPDAERRVLETAAGNPLALLEIPRLLREPFPATDAGSPLPAGATLEAALMAPAERLPSATRTALLVAAVDEHAPRAVLDVALAHAGVDAAALVPAEHARLIARADEGVTFRHPLLRSAVYHAASGPERRAAHAALAAAWPAGSARWTWHAAGAALGPDATVADALDELADGAHDRGAHSAAARAFHRAAELSPTDADRYRRRLRAANNLILVGAVEDARRLLDLARDEAPPEGSRSDLEELQGRLALRRNNPQSARRALLAAADRIEDADPLRAAELILEATLAGMMAGDSAANLADGRRALELAEGRDEVVATAAEIIYGHGLIGTGRVAEGEARLGAAVERVHRLERVPPSVEGVAQAAHISLWAERYDLAEAILDWLERAVRRAGAAGALGMPLAVRARMELRRGRFVRALAAGTEALELAEQTGQTGLRCVALAWVAETEARLGREADARRHAEEALGLARVMNADVMEVYPRLALAWNELGLGRVEPAVDQLVQCDAMLDRLGLTDPGFVPVRPLLIEALTRAGETEEAGRLLAEWEQRVRDTGRVKGDAFVAHSRGLLASDGEYETWFARALELHGRGEDPFSRARTLLALGVRRRRSRRRAAAREPLAEALSLFERLGAATWATQARRELELAGAGDDEDGGADAAGSALEALTPQELHVAVHVGRGLSNREVAAALFVSSRTVEAHLRQIYRKLDLRSRTQLARLVAESDDAGWLA